MSNQHDHRRSTGHLPPTNPRVARSTRGFGSETRNVTVNTPPPARRQPVPAGYCPALPGGEGGATAGPTARPAPAPPSALPARRGGAGLDGGGSQVAPAREGGDPAPAPRPTLRELVEPQRWRPDATGALARTARAASLPRRAAPG